MRTTIDIPDETYCELKIKAAREKKPVREIVLRALKRELESAEGIQIRKMRIPVIPSSRPGTLNLTNEQIDDLIAFS
ncbi:MAG: hypothetical protein ABSE46_03715 [Terracidiphilus sp.]|jgi:hypothetical protein